MSAIFIHISDIHFGQERDQRVHIHTDVKAQLIADARDVVRNQLQSQASGLLVTGDIAFSGVKEQYAAAAVWLDQLATAVGCPISQVQMIPGNHDVDRTKSSVSSERVLDVIRAGGAEEYEKVIANAVDRAALFARFADYGQFCFGYQCDLDPEAKFATNLRIELAPGRAIRFIRMNSSLLCTGDEKDDNPELMVGERQFIIPRNVGEENIVLIHHPLNWYKDAGEVRRYIRSRARVFISGHEHDPRVSIDQVEGGGDLMMLAAGATVPFKSDAVYTFTYNIIEFDWDAELDALSVTIHPRAWNPVGTRFEADEKRLGGKDPCFKLGSPHFRHAPTPGAETESTVKLQAHSSPAAFQMPIAELVPADADSVEPTTMPPVVDGYDLNLLRFFRDLLEGERLRLLVALDAVPRVGSRTGATV